MIGEGNSMQLIIISAVVGIIVISVIAYYVARAMKGNMKLALEQKSVSSGDEITGKLSVEVKKPIVADRLYLALVGEREERRRSSSSGQSSTRWVEFYRDEADVLTDEPLRAGFTETYNFTLNTPSEGHVATAAETAMKAIDSMEDGITKNIAAGIGQVAAAGMRLGGRKRWKVLARLETKGVDLATSEKIHVSLKSAV